MACAVHCLALPLLLVAVPTLAGSLLLDESFHLWMLMAVLPTSLIALTLGCRKHRNPSALTIAVPGLLLLAFAAFFGHDLLGEIGEKIVSLLAAAMIAFSHLKNYRLCQQLNCRDQGTCT